MTPTQTVRLVLVDDHAMFRSGVKAELGGASVAAAGWTPEIVGEAADVDTAGPEGPQTQTQVVLIHRPPPRGGGQGGAAELPPWRPVEAVRWVGGGGRVIASGRMMRPPNRSPIF